MLNFYDFEVFMYDWMVVIINPVTREIVKIVNDVKLLEEYYSKHKFEIWIGFNNRRYDQYIFKGVLLGMNPKEINDFIIKGDNLGWQFSNAFRKIKMINYDVMLKVDRGLKTFEAMLGNDIRETTVDFNIRRKLTDGEIEETLKYCQHDVEQTIEVFTERKAEFDASMGLINIFDLPRDCMGKTKAQIVAIICGGKGQRFHDDFDFKIVDVLSVNKYVDVVDWYLNPSHHDYRMKYIRNIAGVPHTFAWGGLHGAKEKYYGEGYYLMADVEAYYPAMQVQFKFGYRNMSKPENFEKIHSENLRQKRLGNKKARLPYKIADNSMSGQLKDKYSKLYDPRENNNIVVNGQLLLLDLIEKLEDKYELIQSNTDGILIKLNHRDDYDYVDDIVWEWEQRTGMRMGFDLYIKVFQKDVNNYLIVAEDGSYKSKGKYVMKLDNLNNELAIVNEALVKYMLERKPVEQTINECDDMVKFQKVVKVSSGYMHALKNPTYKRTKMDNGKTPTGRQSFKTVEVYQQDGEIVNDKTLRVFASNRENDGIIAKVSKKTGRPEKFADTPEKCFIYNGVVKGKPVPKHLDKQWYIDLAKKRLEHFGVL